MKKRLRPLAAAAIAVVAGLGLARPASGQTGWRSVDGAMSSGMALPAVVALPDGRVILMGGQDLTTSPLDTVNIYDSASNSWLPNAAPMNRSRVYASAVVLPDGRALIVGGIDSLRAMSATAEIYDPATNTWTLTASMPRGFAAGSAVALNDGRVLVLGGINPDDDSTTTDATMLFDPSSGTWALGPPLLTSRFLQNATLLPDGKVLVSGGLEVGSSGSSVAAAAELFDPASHSWSAAGQMAQAGMFAVSAVLPDGRVIVAGGSTTLDSSGALARVEIYDPATNQWQAAAPMSKPRGWGGGGVTADGKFVMAAGISTQVIPEGLSVALESSAEAYDWVADAWTPIESMTTPRYYVGSVVVNGELLLAGGVSTLDAGGILLTSGEVYVSTPNNPPAAVASAPATVPGVAGGLVVVEVSAAASSDPDGNPLSFVWSEGAATLATSADPVRTAFVALGVGGHTLTLTVRDTRGGESTATVFVDVVDAAAGQQAQITQLTHDLLQTQAQITELTADLLETQAQLAAAGQSAADAVARIQTRLRTALRDPSFIVPGGDPAAQLEAIVDAVVRLKHDGLQQLYRSLKPPSHGGGHGRDDDHGKSGHGKGSPKKDDHKKDDRKKDERGRR